MTAARKEQARPRARRDWGRVVAFGLCVLFGFVGTVPLGVGFLVRTARVRTWAARETAALLARELGVRARYEVTVQAWPMLVGLEHVRVEATDGGSPVLEVERVAVRPRPFSLLAGQLEAGDVEIVGPRLRVVVEGGQLRNLRVKLPESSPRAPAGRAPFASVAVTDAHIDAIVDGVRVAARELDVDVSAEEDGAWEVALRAGTTAVTRIHPFVGREATEDAVDEDVICRLEVRARVDGDVVLVRRLRLEASADLDPDPGTAPSCRLEAGDWRAVDVRLGAVRVRLPRDAAPGPTPGTETPAVPLQVSGRVYAKLPGALAHRFKDLAHVSGSIELDVKVDYDGHKLPDGRDALPGIAGHLTADTPGVDGKVFARHLTAEVSTLNNTLELSEVVADWADGKALIAKVVLDPFARPVSLSAGPLELQGLEFNALMRDLGAHPQAHVAWSLREGHLEHFGGTLDPLALEGPISVTTRGFEVFDRVATDPARRHMVGVHEGTVRGMFTIRPAGVLLKNMSIDTPRSHLVTSVALNFNTTLTIDVQEGAHVDLADLSPLVDIPVAGHLGLRASAHGPFGHPMVEADLSIREFVFGGFAVGDVESAKARFEPLVLRLENARVKHGASRVRVPVARFAFDEGAAVVADADLDTREGPHLALRDFFEIFHFDRDPRYFDRAELLTVPRDQQGIYRAKLSGRGHVHYALGGREDRCGGGLLDVRAAMALSAVTLFGERFDEGNVDLSFVWDDVRAGDAGMVVDVPSASLRKGAGAVLASLTVRPGGLLQGNAIATGIPLKDLDTLGPLGRPLDGTVSMVADLGGRLAAPELSADVALSRLRIGPASLPSSRLRVRMEPGTAPRKLLPRTRCGNTGSAPPEPGDLERDAPDGLFRVSGSLFEGQVTLDDLRVTQQKHKKVEGKVVARKLDLGTLANLIPGVAFAGSPPTGSLSATLDIKSLPLDAPKHADVTLAVTELELERDRGRVKLLGTSGPLSLREDELSLPELSVQARTASGLSAVFVGGGEVHRVMSAPDVDLYARVQPIDLSKLGADIPAVARAGGAVDASLRIGGPVAALRYTGAAHLRRGELALKGSPFALDEVEVDIEVGGGDVRIKRATGKVGGGAVELTGRMPVRGLELGEATARIVAHGVKLPVADGIDLTADADLEASYRPGAERDGGQRNVPAVHGTVALTSFSYTRPIALSLSLGQLAGRPARTSVDSYDPADDVVRFNLVVVSPQPLRFSNNLVDMKLQVVDPGLVLSGTNQRFGARGILRVLPESKIQLRNNEFDVREGFVRFDDPSRIAPKVDVRAQTEYRRAAVEQAGPTAAEGGSSGAAASGVAAATSGASGLWRIGLHLQGDADNLKMGLTSDPSLSQEDIVLLLTMGMTRAEIDRGLASSLGETVGLEALSALTGADKAVKTILPLIDEFRFGTGYSSKTGQTEPTVTLGKRITEQLRASVTTGVTENSEVRSNLEWKLGRRMSIQGSYDNVNDNSSSSVGNIGVDLRWRLEFE